MSNQVLASALFGGSSDQSVMIDVKVGLSGYRYVLMDNRFKFTFDFLAQRILAENENFVDGTAAMRLTSARILENLSDLYTIADQKASCCFARFCIWIRDYFQGIRSRIEEGAKTGLNFLLYSEKQFQKTFGIEAGSVKSHPAYLEVCEGWIRVKKEEVEKIAKAESSLLQAAPKAGPSGRIISQGFRPAVEPIPDVLDMRDAKYLKDCCIEAGLAETGLCDIYAFGSDKPCYQELRTTFMTNVKVTRQQVASLCLLKYLQGPTQDVTPEDSLALQALSQDVSQLTDQEIAEIRNYFAFPGNTCSSKLLNITQNIQAQASILREHPRFLEAFFELPLPRKAAEKIDESCYQLHIPDLSDYPE